MSTDDETISEEELARRGLRRLVAELVDDCTGRSRTG
jgi:hypothetical protein